MVQKTPLWSTIPAVMIRKCARVAALRTAYPEAFGGLYIHGERTEDTEDVEGVLERPGAPNFSSPVLPQETLTRLSTPQLEVVPEKEPVPAGESGGESTPLGSGLLSIARGEAPRGGTGVPLADDIIARAAQVKTEGERLGLCEEARALPRGEARRKAVQALEDAKARLFNEKMEALKAEQTEAPEGEP
jgi:hypothetical protein